VATSLALACLTYVDDGPDRWRRSEAGFEPRPGGTRANQPIWVYHCPKWSTFLDQRRPTRGAVMNRGLIGTIIGILVIIILVIVIMQLT
jgi:hypothetical protein